MAWYGVMLSCVVWYGTLRCGVVWCGVVCYVESLSLSPCMQIKIQSAICPLLQDLISSYKTRRDPRSCIDHISSLLLYLHLLSVHRRLMHTAHRPYRFHSSALCMTSLHRCTSLTRMSMSCDVSHSILYSLLSSIL